MQIGTCRQAIEQFQLDRKRHADAFEDVERAERSLPKVKKRLTQLKDAWSKHQHGKPLRPEV